jgi:hypothetical protein
LLKKHGIFYLTFSPRFLRKKPFTD